MRKWTRRLLRTIAVLFVLVNVMAWFHARKFTHFAEQATEKTDASQISPVQKLSMLFTGVDLPRPQSSLKPDRPYETIILQSNKKIECWKINVAQSKGTVLLCHGYGGEKSSMLERAYVFADAGYTVLLPDFMGAGGSEGNECTIGYTEAENVKTCVDYLAKESQQPIYVLGSSMGAVAAMRACSKESLPVRALILECPFGSMRQTVKNRFDMVNVPSFPLSDMLVFWGGIQNGFNAFSHNPEDYAKQIRIPVLLLYGEQDDRVRPFEIAHIFNNLAGVKVLVKYPLAGHESYLNKYKEQWTHDVLHFLDTSGK